MSLMSEIVNDNNQSDTQSTAELLQKAMEEVYPSELIQSLKQVPTASVHQIEDYRNKRVQQRLRSFYHRLSLLEDIMFDLREEFNKLHAELQQGGGL